MDGDDKEPKTDCGKDLIRNTCSTCLKLPDTTI